MVIWCTWQRMHQPFFCTKFQTVWFWSSTTRMLQPTVFLQENRLQMICSSPIWPGKNGAGRFSLLHVDDKTNLKLLCVCDLRICGADKQNTLFRITHKLFFQRKQNNISYTADQIPNKQPSVEFQALQFLINRFWPLRPTFLY